MATLVHRLSTALRLGETVYAGEVWGERRDDGLWHGWIEFVPSDGGRVLRTGQETSQSNLEALTYWATGLEPVYLDGALARAIGHQRAA
ncbi:MAG TPA: hypothetical protein VK548_08675 [Candidatus Acidoferrum sp.]|nr:hypothetical protein [Candidatus Acidoferrum sp.]